MDRVCQLGYPVLFGISRKRVVDALLGGNTKAKERDGATAALSAYALGKAVRLYAYTMSRLIKTLWLC